MYSRVLLFPLNGDVSVDLKSIPKVINVEALLTLSGTEHCNICHEIYLCTIKAEQGVFVLHYDTTSNLL